VLQYLDGAHTLEEVRSEYQRYFHKEIPIDLLHQVVQKLDQGYFLDNDTFRGFFAELAESFGQAKVREAHHAGVSYSRDPVGLCQSLSDLFSKPKGPGLPDASVGKGQVTGVVVPHIDLRLGGSTYAWAYKQLAERKRPDVVIILGTGHHGLRNLFSLTRKCFRTPLGELPVDMEFTDRLISLYPYDLFSEEMAHRTEHTIEFQLLFLQLLFGEAVSIVPVLCSFAYPMVNYGKSAEIIRQFTDALRAAISQDCRRILVVASADLAHVGPRYGDPEGFAGESLSRIKEADRQMLTYVEKMDAEGFLDFIAGEADKRRICGFSPIYVMLKVLGAQKGTVLAHDHGEMDQYGSVCSYASVIFE
jgi:AmmeMemoRadiSam system protein B